MKQSKGLVKKVFKNWNKHISMAQLQLVDSLAEENL